MKDKIIVTSALLYANGPVHIGHLAGVYLPADIYARFQRRKQKEVIFIGGSDEYGIPIIIRAKKENKSPKEIINFYFNQIKNTLYAVGISLNHYSRTSSETHHKTAKDFFLNLLEKKILIEQESQQFYDEKEKQFLADRYIIGICPNCKNHNAYGDQCEKCGKTLSPDELINPKSVLSGKSPILKNTKNWYIQLNKYSNFINEWILKKHKHDWKKNIYGQVNSWIQEGLKNRSITRDLNWGIPLPLKNIKGKVLYVWFEAPIGYISATKEWCNKNKKNWKDFWKDPNTKLIQFIGKDNIVFHSIIFPIMLHKHEGYILPHNIPANEFLNLENKKISTSKNWAIWVHEYLKEFPNKEDVLRYVLITNIPEEKDSNFTWKDFQTRNNTELVGILGNFINRVLILTKNFFHGKVPSSRLTNYEKEKLINFINIIDYSISKFKFRNAIIEYINLARFGNKYLQYKEPWKLSDKEKIKHIMYVSIQILGVLYQIMEIFMPFTAQKLSKMLNFSIKKWEDIKMLNIIPVNHQFNSPKLLFEKIEDIKINEQINKLFKNKKCV